MKRFFLALCTLCCAGIGTSVAAPERSWAELRKLYDQHDDLRHRANALIPRPRYEPLRYAGISDIEVSEVLAASPVQLSRSAVYIGPVVVGCPCEDGSGCKYQVWVAANIQSTPIEFLFSMIDDHWKIGPVQQWWLDHRRLEKAPRTRDPGNVFSDNVEAHYMAFPRCVSTN